MSLKKSIKPHSKYGIKEESKLADCPFCGREGPETIAYADENEIHEDEIYRVTCQRCLATGPRSMVKEIAIKSWNKRAICK